MSRIGRKSILIPDGVEVKIEENIVKIKGPKGELSLKVTPEIKIEIVDNKISFIPKIKNKQTNSFWGLTRTLVSNMVKGVTEGFEKKLEIKGVGFKANIEGENLVLNVGYSHPVKIKIPEGLKISVEKNIINVSGIDKELVGQVAANIRKVKKPEPYKGKGIRYLGEVVKKKVGKKVGTTTTTG